MGVLLDFEKGVCVMIAREFAVADVVNCPFRGGDRENQRLCEMENCMCWTWTQEDVKGYCALAGAPAAS